MKKRVKIITAMIVAIVMVFTIFPSGFDLTFIINGGMKNVSATSDYQVVYTSSDGLKETLDGNAFYYFDSIPQKNVTDTAKIEGWILGKNIGKITAVINGMEYTCTRKSREDVKKAYPEYDVSQAGFLFDLKVVQLKHGKNTLSIRAYTTGGTYNEIYIGTVDAIKLDGEYFDWSWYYFRYHSDEEVNAIGRDYAKLLEHYYSKGIKNGYSPCVGFDPQWYIEKNTGVTDNFMDAYVDFIKKCIDGDEKKNLSPFLNLTFYQQQNAELKGKTAKELFYHFCSNGYCTEKYAIGSDTNQAKALTKMFVAKEYAAVNKDVKEECGDGTTLESAKGIWSHWFAYALADNEKRVSSNEFDMAFYMKKYEIPSVEEAFWRYINSGYADREQTKETKQIATEEPSQSNLGTPEPQKTIPPNTKPPVTNEPSDSDIYDSNSIVLTNFFKYYGDAKFCDDGAIQLTSLSKWTSGSVWYEQACDITNGMKISFDYWAGGGHDNGYGGADGFMLMLSDEVGLGESGGNLGFILGEKSYGVEFDSYYNPERDPLPGGKHIAIIEGNTLNHLNSINTTIVDDEEWHHVEIKYSNSVIQIYVDQKLMLEYTGIQFGKSVYIGYSASTGDGVNIHKIKNPVLELTATDISTETVPFPTEQTLFKPTENVTVVPTNHPLPEPTENAIAVPESQPTPEPTAEVTEAPSQDKPAEYIPDNNSTTEKYVLSAENSQVELEQEYYIYTGKAKQPAIIVMYDSEVLAKEKDYTVSYSNNKNVGTATIMVTGIGKYTGKIVVNFFILPPGTSFSGKITAKSNSFSVKWNKQSQQISGYEIQYSTSKKFTSKSTISKKIKASSTKMTVSKLKAKKKYYVRIRTYKKIGVSRYYSGWSAAKMVKTK